MNKSKKASPSKEDKVAESAATAYSESDNTQPDEDKSQREAEKQGDKVAESTSAAYNQSVTNKPDKNQSLPPKVNTKRKKVVKSATTNQNQSQRVNKQSPPDDKKAAKSTSTANIQSDQQQPDNDSSSPPAYMQYYATKEDLSNAKGEIIEKMDEKFTDVRREMAENQADNRVKFEELRHEITKARLWVVATIPISIGFFIAMLKLFSG